MLACCEVGRRIMDEDERIERLGERLDRLIDLLERVLMALPEPEQRPGSRDARDCPPATPGL